MTLSIRVCLLGFAAVASACGSSSNDDLFSEVSNTSGSGSTAGTSYGGEAGTSADTAGSGGTGSNGGAHSGGSSGAASASGDAGTGSGGSAGSTPGPAECGNAVLEAGEECDDGNANADDGCTNQCVVQCGSVMLGSVRFANRCYWVREHESSWPEAKSACEYAGGHLVTITSSAENEFVRDLAEGNIWIGAYDGRQRHDSELGTYTWVTSEPFTFQGWGTGKPNVAETPCIADQACYEHCAVLESDGTWNDYDCERDVASGGGLGYVCEWDGAGQLPL